MFKRLERRRSFSAFHIDPLERRVLLSGELDPAFGTGGFVAGPAGAAQPGYSDAAAVLQPDGKLLVSSSKVVDNGSSYPIVVFRFLANGSLDSSFGTDGSVSFGDNNPDSPTTIAETSTGEIFVGYQGFNTGDHVVAINSNGTINTAFGNAGDLTLPANDTLNTIAADGNNLLVSVSFEPGTALYNTGAILRYLPTGSLDTTFANAGTLSLSSPTTDLTVNPAGDLIVLDGENIQQFNADGSVDTSFAGTGLVAVPGIQSIAPQLGPAGQIYVVTNNPSVPDGQVTRLTAGGLEDSTFSSFTFTSVPVFPLVAVESDGSVVIASGQAPATFTHYTTAGAADVTSAGINIKASQILVLSSGEFIAVGSALQGTVDSFAAVEITAAGTPDPSFGTGGQLTALNAAAPPSAYTAITTQSDGKVIAGGIASGSNENQVFCLVRFNANGSLDTTFGSDGVATVSAGTMNVESISLLVEPDGEIIAAGNLSSAILYDTTATAFAVAAFTSNGTLDTTFGSGGTLIYQGETGPSMFYQNGSLIVASDQTVRTMTETGSVASSFTTNLTGVVSIGIQPNGQLLFATADVDPTGTNPTTTALHRFNTNGTVDTAFGTGGTVATADSVGVQQVLTESSGTILELETMSPFSGFSGYNLVAFNSNGSSDTGFGSHGTAAVSLGGSQLAQNLVGASVVQQSDGSLLVSAAFFSTDSSQYAVVNQYSATGQVETTFGTHGSATVGSNVTVKYATFTVTSVGAIAALDSAGDLLLTGGNGPVGANIFAVETTGSAVPGPATKLVFESQPPGQTGQTLPATVVELEDANGALASMDASTVTLALSGGTAGATLSGTVSSITNTVMDGFATFGGVNDGPYNISAAGNGYVLTATDGTLTPVNSSSFNVQAPQLAFATQPTSGLVINPLGTVVVNIENSDGTLDTDANSSVTLALSGGTGGTLAGATTVNASGGVATFGGLSISAAGEGYTLTASSGTDTPATSNPFNEIEPQLVFTSQPFDATTAGTPGPVTVAVEDGSGNIITTDDTQVGIIIAGATAGATLTGTTQVTAVNGVATFSDFSVSTAGKNYTLNAIDGSYLSGSSSEFTITTPSPETATLGKVILPAANIAGTKLNAQVPVTITNTAGVLHWKLAIDVFADTTTRLDGNQVLLTSISPTELLHMGTKKGFDFLIRSLPATLASGTYHLLVEVIDPLGGTTLVVANPTIAVTAAVVQPAVSVANVLPVNIAIGKLGYVWVTVTNDGNVAARGVDFTLGVSADGLSPVAGVILDTAKAAGTVFAPGSSRRFRLRFKITAAVPAGVYFPYVSISLGGVTATSVGSATFTAG